jgi:orotate phosphoribosyltransferase-like protein
MIDIADIVIHVHKNLLSEHLERIEEEVSALEGVISVNFSHQIKHRLTVVFDPMVTTSKRFLNLVKQWDKNAFLL